MPSTITVTRRVLLVLIAALTLLLVQTASAPATAHADVLWPNTVSSSHYGWVKVRPRAFNDVCGFAPPCGVTAFEWTGQKWKTTKIGWSADVYAYPYASGWHWIWTQSTGWLAIQTRELRRESIRCGSLYRC